MLQDLLLILILGFIAGKIFEMIKLPGLLGMLITGVIIGPSYLDLLSEGILEISGDIRLIALVIILLRAGLGLHRETLEKVGALALKLGSIPCLLEGFVVMGLARMLLGMEWMEAGVLAFIIAAVSPAVIVPSMLKLMEKRIGENKGIPAMILAGASIDDVFAITLISIFLGALTTGNEGVWHGIFGIPREIIGGVLLGLFVGLFLSFVFKKFRLKGSDKMLLLVIGALFSYVISELILVAGLLAVMVTGVFLLEKNKVLAEVFSKDLKGVWAFGEIFLFVFIGAIVDVSLAISAGPVGLLIISIGILGRVAGVYVSTIGSVLNKRERLFCGIAYFPKATVQAAMGSIPLAYGVEGGELILAISVLAVVFTAPIGAIGIDLSAKHLLGRGKAK